MNINTIKYHVLTADIINITLHWSVIVVRKNIVLSMSKNVVARVLLLWVGNLINIGKKVLKWLKKTSKNDTFFIIYIYKNYLSNKDYLLYLFYKRFNWLS